MPILIGVRTAIPAPATALPGNRIAREQIVRDWKAGAQDVEGLDAFAAWAVAWLETRQVTRPVLYPLPAFGMEGGAALADAVARRTSSIAVCPILRWRGAPPEATCDDQRPLFDALDLDGAIVDGDPVPVGPLFDPHLLRAAALRLADAGAKPMHALYAARIGANADDEVFSVR